MISHNAPIANTFGIKAQASTYLEYDSVEELREALLVCPRPLLPVGAGSNLLLLNDFEGTVIHSGIKSVEVVAQDGQSVEVRVGAGLCWDYFVALCVERGWYGAENLSLIPGEVGSSAVQNIGAYGAEAADLIVSVEVMNPETGEISVLEASECRFGYRSSIFKSEPHIILYVHYRLSLSPSFKLGYGALAVAAGVDPTLASVRAAVIATREAKLPDPAEIGSAGSFFMNPVVDVAKYESLAAQYPEMPHYPAPEGRVKLSAGWLIDQCGWKGRNLGPAGVWHKQALVLVNNGGATAADILSLADAIIADVRSRFGIELRPEVIFVG
ncbi:MAG: UDP-N-acetylmuramate dehydrogenase [Bacteroidales bacterium]|nr:UDP-N-acetylmuramate dehydrogenase [Bacteroidales bacterium]